MSGEVSKMEVGENSSRKPLYSETTSHNLLV